MIAPDPAWTQYMARNRRAREASQVIDALQALDPASANDPAREDA